MSGQETAISNVQLNPAEQSTPKLLMTVKEIIEATGWGETKVRAILNRPDSSFTIRCGKNIYAHRKLFEKYLEKCATYGIKI